MSSIGRREFLATTALALTARAVTAGAGQRRLLYVAEPGIRNYVDYGGVGVLVFDVDADYRFVSRIPTWDVAAGPGARERERHRRERADRPPLRQTLRRIACFDLADGSPALGRSSPRAAATALRSRPMAGSSSCRRSRDRTGTCSTRRRARRRRRSSRIPARTTRSMRTTAGACTWPASIRPCCRLPIRHPHRS